MKKLTRLLLSSVLGLCVVASASAELVTNDFTTDRTTYTTKISGKECELELPIKNTPERLQVNKDMLAKIKSNNKNLLAEQMKLEKPFITDLYADPRVKENIKAFDVLMDRMVCGHVYTNKQLREFFKLKKEFEGKTNLFVKKVAKANPNHKELNEKINLFLADTEVELRKLEDTFLFLINHYKLECGKLYCEKITKL